MTDDKAPKTMPLPLVVQLGFAGSRRLVDASQHPAVDAVRFEAEIETWLAARLQKLRQDLGLEGRHFFCGISSIAIGGDTVFCKACRANRIPVRIFLPQTRDEFLDATGSEGPDFPAPHKEEALSLLNSEHIIQERLVSDASKRGERFEDVNREIVRVSDVLICLKREGAQGKIGGTEALIDRTVQGDKLVLVVQVGIQDGKPHFTEEWRLPQPKGNDPEKNTPTTPAKAFKHKLPREARTVAGLHLPANAAKSANIENYAGEIKRLSSEMAGKMHRKFTRMAMMIIGAHILATILAALALGFARVHLLVIPILLGLELAMLAVGLWVHERLHKTKTSHAWAEARLLAEVTRSVLAVGNLHVYLEHLFSLPFPAAIRPVLRTINVLQLQSTRQDHADWKEKRNRYVDKRLTMPKSGQIDFYDRRTRESKTLLTWFHTAFYVFWIAASISTVTKLAMHSYFETHVVYEEFLTAIMGTLAIVTPVLAVAALSLAAAMDLEAQKHTYREMLVFLEAQKEYLNTASSERDYARLVIETEYQLLGETANWFSRRSYTSVA